MNLTAFLLASADIDDMNLETALLQLQKDVTECENYLAQQQKQLNIKALEQQITKDIQKMVVIGARINTLAAQLEAKILSLRKIALDINQQISKMETMKLDKSTLCYSNKCNILEIYCSTIPILIHHDSRFILKSKPIDFLHAEQQESFRNQVSKSPQQKREALEQWLVSQRKQMINKFYSI